MRQATIRERGSGLAPLPRNVVLVDGEKNQNSG